LGKTPPPILPARRKIQPGAVVDAAMLAPRAIGYRARRRERRATKPTATTSHTRLHVLNVGID
jgi:hypothetical protein